MNYLYHAQKNNAVSKGGTNKNSQEVDNRELLQNHEINNIPFCFNRVLSQLQHDSKT